jgi:asparagine synthase (glutamine-hydrolysing)
MSAIFGVFHLDGAPAERELLEKMSRSLSVRASDGEGLVTLGPVALGHRMFHTTPESLQETQPHRDEMGSLWLTLDGRVDNREELRTLLEAKGIVLRQDTDAELVLCAYEAWGEECPARILGDFAFALWDVRRRRLFLARDFLGIKPLYYATVGTRFVFASALHPLLLAPGFERRPNEGMIAEYLSCYPADLKETVFRDVFRLPPAHRMTVTTAAPPGAVRYWSADNIQEVHEKDDSAFEARFQEVFHAAVRSRMRCQGPVGAELSGGLDSSSIVSVMNAVSPASFETFSLVFPGLPNDETEFITAVLSKTGARGNLISQPDVHPTTYAEQAATYSNIPNCPVTTAYSPLLDRVREKGIRVLLSGNGGDDWFTGSPMYYADLLKGMRLLVLARYIRQDARAEAFYRPYRKIYTCGIRPLLPESLVRMVRRWKRRDVASAYPWISRDLFARSRLGERLSPPSWLNPSGKGFAYDDVRRVSLDAVRLHVLEVLDRSGSEYQVEYRYPFHDRRVVEFSLSLPEPQRRAPGLSKNVLRRAMKDLLPRSIAIRRTKAEGSHSYAEALEAMGGTAAFEKLAVEDLGWIHGVEVRRMVHDLLASYHSGEDYSKLTWPVWRVLAVELWVRYSLLKPSGQAMDGHSRGRFLRTDSQEEMDHVASPR